MFSVVLARPAPPTAITAISITVTTPPCNGHVTSGCQPTLLSPRTGGWPSYIGLDPADGAMHVPDNVDRAVSILPITS